MRPLSLQKQRYGLYDRENDWLAVRCEYSHVTLWREDAAELPALAETLEQTAATLRRSMEEEYNDLCTDLREEDLPWVYEGMGTWVSTLDVQVRRADTVAVSLLSDSYEHHGWIEALRRMHGTTYDTQTGQELALSDVVRDTSVIPALVTAALDGQTRLGTDFSITELDMETLGGDMDTITLGMAADGIVSAFKWYPWREGGLSFRCEGADCGAVAWCSGVETTEYEMLEVLWIKQLSGLSPLCEVGQTVTLYESEFGITGVVNDAVLPFLGEWMDAVSGRCYLSVTASGSADEAHIRVEWGDSATETYVWTMTGTPGEYEVALCYNDCTCRIVEYGDYGAEIVKDTLYTNGRGSITLADVDTLFWADENFARSNDCRFTPVSAQG